MNLQPMFLIKKQKTIAIQIKNKLIIKLKCYKFDTMFIFEI